VIRPRQSQRALVVALLTLAAPALAQAPPRAAPDAGSRPAAPVPVVAVGDGATFAAALTQAVRMAVESGAGLALTSSLSARGEHVVADSIHTVSRGVVTRYVLLDSASGRAGVRVRILALVARIDEPPLIPGAASTVEVPGALWAAGGAVHAERAREEGEIVGQIFGRLTRVPGLYTYRAIAGPPVPDHGRLRLRLEIARQPNANYTFAVRRLVAVLGALAGPAGDRVLEFPPNATQIPTVHPCVSVCGTDQRRLLDPRAVLAATDSFAGFDPPVVTAGAASAVPALFPALATAGGFAVAIVDADRTHVRVVHVRSSRAFFTVVDYARTVIDEARFRLDVGAVDLALRQTTRRPWTGAPDVALMTTDSIRPTPVALVKAFREHTAGGPGFPLRAGSQDVILWIPAAAYPPRPDTAVIDVWLEPAQLAGLRQIRVTPLETTRRFLPAHCRDRRLRWPDASVRTTLLCRRPEPVDAPWRALTLASWSAPE
jgi:hypothetical protein